MSPDQAAAEGDAPLEQFTQCHAGIRHHLNSLGELPALLAAAQRARHLAGETLDFFHKTIHAHHAEEERELFPAVQSAAAGDDEAAYVRSMAERLTREHRQIEAAWAKIEPSIKDMARGRDSTLDPAVARSLVAAYRAHADYEEQVYLPLAQRILSRNGDQMAALAISLHMRHVMPEVLGRFGHRI